MRISNRPFLSHTSEAVKKNLIRRIFSSQSFPALNFGNISSPGRIGAHKHAVAVILTVTLTLIRLLLLGPLVETWLLCVNIRRIELEIGVYDVPILDILIPGFLLLISISSSVRLAV